MGGSACAPTNPCPCSRPPRPTASWKAATSTVVAVALPAIGRNLHVGFQDLQWTVMSYTLTLASLILLAGSLSDRWGRRRV
ncbi:MFS transporter, partial [Trebonia sp.]|uniref:MFS transporter n=1 Tax=Trebonia sp. TaxID=2767075 RepID=UPI003BAE307E